jgi:hypothetical protein
VSNRFDAAVVALGSLQGFSDAERETVVALLRRGHGRVDPASERSAAVTSLTDRAFTWPEFDRWQAFFGALGTFPARWDGLHVVPPPRTSPAGREAYQYLKLDLLLEWLDALARRSTVLAHYTRQGMRARIVRQGDGQRCPVCDPFNSYEVRHRNDTMPPFHPGCRCLLLAVNGRPCHGRIKAHDRLRSRAL